MMPYFHLDEITLGPLTLHVWGLVAGLAFIVAFVVASKRAQQNNLNPEHLWSMGLWIFFSAIIGARLVHVFAYEWTYYQEHLTEIPLLWNGGLASFGGYVGGTLAALLYFKKYRLPFLPWADALIFATPLGIGIGRIGCYLTNMHPGIQTTFFLGVHYPDAVRHDLGLYLSLNGFFLFFIFLALARKQRPSGFYLTLFLLWYGVTRFFLDFLRTSDLPMSDVRYFSLTPAQYGSIGFFIIGLTLVLYLRSPHPNPLPKGEGT